VGLALVLAWTTFLAGGVYTWVWLPALAAILLLAASVRPRVFAERGRRVDVMLVAVFVACVAQMVPVPAGLIQSVDPYALAIRQALWLPPVLSGTHVPWIPFTIAPRDTLEAAGILLLAMAMFWTCRRVCEDGGTGRLVRTIAAIGLVASIAAIVQRSQRIDLLYGVWHPLDAGARPYGPFVNRNHTATWMIMGCPLVFGYLLARAPHNAPTRDVSQRIANALKQLGTMRVWLVAAVCIMTLAVILSGSRSGLIGLVTAFGLSAVLISRRRTNGVRRWVTLQFSVVALVVVWFANYDVLLRRFEESIAGAQEGRGRLAIWRDAIRIVQDFPVAGTGAGTFSKAITAYQTAEPGYAIDQAHNHYLQIMAEGAAALVVPATIAAGLFLLLAIRELEQDVSSDYLIRAGACSGIGGVLVQSFWETGLTMPANALLFAMLAAIATFTDPRVARGLRS
jgi:O-antigen ligase